MNVLDITSFKQEGPELYKAILEAVKDTQRVIIQELPNVISMTKKQFEMLKPSQDFFVTTVQGEYLYRTPYNVMEVDVTDLSN